RNHRQGDGDRHHDHHFQQAEAARAMLAMSCICFQTSHKHLPLSAAPCPVTDRHQNSCNCHKPGISHDPMQIAVPTTVLVISMVGTVPLYVKVPGYTGLSYTGLP